MKTRVHAEVHVWWWSRGRRSPWCRWRWPVGRCWCGRRSGGQELLLVGSEQRRPLCQPRYLCKKRFGNLLNRFYKPWIVRTWEFLKNNDMTPISWIRLRCAFSRNPWVKCRQQRSTFQVTKICHQSFLHIEVLQWPKCRGRNQHLWCRVHPPWPCRTLVHWRRRSGMPRGVRQEWPLHHNWSGHRFLCSTVIKFLLIKKVCLMRFKT